MPNYGYHLARLDGGLRRKIYRSFLPKIVARTVPQPGSIPLNVFSFSGEQALPEQVRSIRSFLRHVGHPQSWTVVSDGSYTKRSIALLEEIDSVVTVQSAATDFLFDLPQKIHRYVSDYPMGKQLGLIMSLPRDGPALYLDADILFFPGAADIIETLSVTKAPALYLKDCLDYSVDRRILRDPSECLHPVNAGLLMLLRPLDWSLGILRLLELEGEPDFFTTQTIVQLVMQANGALPFDEEKYVLQLDDQFTYADFYAGSRVALRHYVNPVRHKFWIAAGLR
jgi:hypothetical protein